MDGDGERGTVTRQVAVGAACGAIAWIVGYLVTYVLYGRRIDAAVVSGAVEGWQIAGILFYNAQTVAAEIIQPFHVTAHDFLAAGAAPQLLYLLPPVALALAGLFVAHTTEPSGRIGANVRAGATIVFGYSLLSAGGIVVFAASTGTTVFRPDPVGAILVAGILYPLGFGALGGLGAAFVR